MSASFKIIRSVRNAYAFAGANAGYLARAAVLPLALHTGTMFFLQNYLPDASVIESFLWALPANIAFSWLMFIEARLLLLGERVNALPKDPAYLAERRRLMQASVTVLLLFDMAMTSVAAWMEWALRSKAFGVSVPVTLSVVFLIGGFIWALRFSVIHILVAAGAPLRPFLRRARGLEFPFRLLAMGLLSTLPVYILLQFAVELFLPPLVPGQQLTPEQISTVILVSAPVAVIIPVLLNAAAAFALKDMLGRERAP